MKVWHNLYSKIVTLDYIAAGWKEFRKGKQKKQDVIRFEEQLLDNLFNLHQALVNKTYQPGSYTYFHLTDPKLRLIHKATVVDRVVHHLVSQQLKVIFEPTFIPHSYSCRDQKGTHRGVISLQKMAFKVSRNKTRTCWALKCDIKKFFASVDHRILYQILAKKIADPDFLELLQKIIKSFDSEKGIPIGNLTSQFFANIYLNELDQYIKHTLKVHSYLRYADDFILLSHRHAELENWLDQIQDFLQEKLHLTLHPNKVIYSKFLSGIDFLGYIVFPSHILLRTKTKRRAIKKIQRRIGQYKQAEITQEKLNQTIQSYFGYFKHAHTHKFKQQLQNYIWFWLTD